MTIRVPERHRESERSNCRYLFKKGNPTSLSNKPGSKPNNQSKTKQTKETKEGTGKERNGNSEDEKIKEKLRI